MKLQYRFKYDPTLLGLEGKYEPIGDDSFLIVSRCIQIKNNIVRTGETYFFLERNEAKNIMTTFIKLIDAFYYDGSFYLLIIDLVTGKVLLPSCALDNFQTKSKWKLVDTYSVENMMDDKANKLS